MSKNLETIRAFVAAWHARDVDGLIDLLTEDVCYHNMPVEPVIGAANVRSRVQHFLSIVERIRFDVTHMAETSDGAVLVEKQEHYWLNGKEIVLDSMNTFELKDGKIAHWRAYFDAKTWTAQMPAKTGWRSHDFLEQYSTE